MSIRWTTNLVLALLCFAANGQGEIANYVTNPSFENVILTSTLSTTDGIYGWSAIDSTKRAFFLYSIGPPKFNAPYSSYGFQVPKSGKNMIGSVFFYSNGNPEINRWYPRNRLKSVIKANKSYCARYYVVNTNNSPIGIDAYSILVAGSEIDSVSKCTIPLTFLSPQIVRQGPIVTDTMNWIAISGTFVATGTEKYMVLGNFKSNAGTQTMVINPTYLPNLVNDNYIDDVSLVEMELPAYAGKDTNIVFGDSLFLGRDSDVGIDYACQWYELPNDSVPIDTVAGLWVKPTKKTTYVVRQQLWCSGVKWDTVTVGFDVVGLSEDPFRSLRIYPSITAGEINVCGLSEPGYDITVSDVTGKVIERHVSSEHPCTELFLSLSQGMYFVTVSKGNFMMSKKIIMSN